jgi:hypothetical protein
MKRLFPILLLYALFAGCAAVPLLPLASPFLSGQQPQVATTTSVQLATKNYKIVKTNVVGTSSGFSLLGFISLMSPDYAEAMAQLYQAGGITEGKAQAIVNVMQQNSSTYFILFGIPRITVRADVVEFTEALPAGGP